jgi:hypothetical protein
MHPVVGGAHVCFIQGTHIGSAFHPGDVPGVGTGQETVGSLLLVQSYEGPRKNHLVAGIIVFRLGTVANINTVRFAQLSVLSNPLQEFLVVCSAACNWHFHDISPFNDRSVQQEIRKPSWEDGSHA